MSKNLPVVWTKHLKGDSKDNFEQLLRNSSTVLSRLTEIIEEKEESLYKSSVSISDFDEPNWSHKQAFRNGQMSGLKEVRELLEFIKG